MPNRQRRHPSNMHSAWSCSSNTVLKSTNQIAGSPPHSTMQVPTPSPLLSSNLTCKFGTSYRKLHHLKRVDAHSFFSDWRRYWIDDYVGGQWWWRECQRHQSGITLGYRSKRKPIQTHQCIATICWQQIERYALDSIPSPRSDVITADEPAPQDCECPKRRCTKCGLDFPECSSEVCLMMVLACDGYWCLFLHQDHQQICLEEARPCPNFSNGCDFRGTKPQMMMHTMTCEHYNVMCYLCQNPFPRAQWANHMLQVPSSSSSSFIIFIIHSDAYYCRATHSQNINRLWPTNLYSKKQPKNNTKMMMMRMIMWRCAQDADWSVKEVKWMIMYVSSLGWITGILPCCNHPRCL